MGRPKKEITEVEPIDEEVEPIDEEVEPIDELETMDAQSDDAQEEVAVEKKAKKTNANEKTFLCSHFPDLVIGCASQIVQFAKGQLITSDEEVIKSIRVSQQYEMGLITEQ